MPWGRHQGSTQPGPARGVTLPGGILPGGTLPGGTQIGYPPAGYPPPRPGWGVGTLLGGTQVGYPPAGGDGGGTQLGQQKEYSLHGGRYASCVHAGGLSCSLKNYHSKSTELTSNTVGKF